MEDNKVLNCLRDAIIATSINKRGAALIQLFKAFYSDYPIAITTYAEKKIGLAISAADCLMYFEEIITADNKDDVKGNLGELLERISECI